MIKMGDKFKYCFKDDPSWTTGLTYIVTHVDNATSHVYFQNNKGQSVPWPFWAMTEQERYWRKINSIQRNLPDWF